MLLAQEADRKVVLVDLDLQSGDLAIMLQLMPALSLYDASQNIDRLDPQALAGYLTPHGSGVQLLAAPLEPSVAEAVTADAVARLLEMLQSTFDVVIVDSPAFFTDQVLAAFDVSDEIILVGSMDVPSVKNLRLALTTLAQLGHGRERIRTVLNRADSNVGLRTSEVEKSLDTPIDVQIPSSRDVPLSVNQGIPLAHSKPRSPVVGAIRELLGDLVPQEASSRVAPCSDANGKDGTWGCTSDWPTPSRRLSLRNCRRRVQARSRRGGRATTRWRSCGAGSTSHWSRPSVRSCTTRPRPSDSSRRWSATRWARSSQQESMPLSAADRQRLIAETIDDILGYGPIEPLLQDPDVTEVMCNGPDSVFIERAGKILRSDVTFLDDGHLRRTIEKIVGQVGRRIDESSPYVDARLPDGSRVNAVIPPVSLDGPMLTIRKFSAEAFSGEDLISFGTWSPRANAFLEACVAGRTNILVSGGTGAGKTTTLNVLSGFIPEDERIITVEDAAELRLEQPHVVRLEYRPPNIEGRGEVTIRDLVRNSLRMRPDRIVVGEVRGGEALDMLQAMNTGHDGSISTIHANSPRDAISRLETMVLMAGVELPVRAIREQIAAGIQFIVHQSRFKDGSRRVTHVTELTGMEADVITMQDIFLFDFHAGIDHGDQADTWPPEAHGYPPPDLRAPPRPGHRRPGGLVPRGRHGHRRTPSRPAMSCRRGVRRSSVLLLVTRQCRVRAAAGRIRHHP